MNEEISDYEKRVLANPELVAALDRAREQFENGEGVLRTREDRG